MNLANKISLLRIILIPFFILLFYGFFLWNWSWAGYAAIVVFLLAAFTDFLDGYVARKYHMVSALGKLMDPLADKLFIMSVMVCLVNYSMVAVWAFIVVLAREFLITGLRSVAAAEKIVIAASRWGKAKTVSQIITAGLILVNVFILSESFPAVNAALYACVLIMTALTVYSGVDYMYKNRRLLKN